MRKKQRERELKHRVIEWNLGKYHVEHGNSYLDVNAYLSSLPGQEEPQSIVRLEGEIRVTNDHGGFEDWLFTDVYEDIESSIENTREVMLDEDGPEDLKYNWTQDQKRKFQADIDEARELTVKVVELEKTLNDIMNKGKFLPPEH